MKFEPVMTWQEAYIDVCQMTHSSESLTEAEPDRGRTDDPGRLDLGVAVHRRGVGLVTWLLPPEGKRPAEVEHHADDHRRGHRAEDGEVGRLARRLFRGAPRWHVRAPDQS